MTRTKFEGRYDYKRVGEVRHMSYLRDVCVRCGATIERQPSTLQLFEAGLIDQHEARAQISQLQPMAGNTPARAIAL